MRFHEHPDSAGKPRKEKALPFHRQKSNQRKICVDKQKNIRQGEKTCIRREIITPEPEICIMWTTILILTILTYYKLTVPWNKRRVEKNQHHFGHFLVLVEYVSIALSHERKKIINQFFSN